ncbi:MAG: hypothetical protein ACR2MP_21640, partial [Streptosporangiaceae bacterium]
VPPGGPRLPGGPRGPGCAGCLGRAVRRRHVFPRRPAGPGVGLRRRILFRRTGFWRTGFWTGVLWPGVLGPGLLWPGLLRGAGVAGGRDDADLAQVGGGGSEAG